MAIVQVIAGLSAPLSLIVDALLLYALFQRKNWARIIYIVLHALGFVLIMAMLGGLIGAMHLGVRVVAIISVIVSFVFIIWLNSEDVKEYFGKGK